MRTISNYILGLRYKQLIIIETKNKSKNYWKERKLALNLVNREINGQINHIHHRIRSKYLFPKKGSEYRSSSSKNFEYFEKNYNDTLNIMGIFNKYDDNVKQS
jgi:hypothetical protein